LGLFLLKSRFSWNAAVARKELLCEENYWTGHEEDEVKSPAIPCSDASLPIIVELSGKVD